MKTINFVIAAIIMMSSTAMFAKEVVVNTKKSSVEWKGSKIGGEHEGYIQLKSGSFKLKNDKIVGGNFVIDMTTITNTDIENEKYNKKLVGHLKSDDFFGVEKFPTANFVVTSSTEFKDGKATITGDLTIKGITESISFDVVRDGNDYASKINVDRSKFDVRYGSDSFFDNLGDKVIDDIFTLTIKLVVN
jgi:polyisoprenoid-binding protein YceI